MKIILSPAKKMNVDTDQLDYEGLPVFLKETEEILAWLRGKSREELKKLWVCNDKILDTNIERLKCIDLQKNLTPAILSYEGLAYQYMAPSVFEISQYEYIQKNLRILSGFYGVLKPMDGVVPYRLEMQAKATINKWKNLYDFWGRKLYDEILDDSRIIINLASKEYSKCIEKYLTDQDKYVTIHFCEKVGDKLVTKGTYAKMARGEMVRYMAECQISTPEELKGFHRLGYVFQDDISSETDMIWIKEK